MANLIHYARSATNNSQSLALQVAEGDQWAEQHGHRIVARFAEVASGLADELPMWDLAVQKAIETRSDILVRDLSRVSRDPAKHQERLDALTRHGLKLLFTTAAN